MHRDPDGGAGCAARAKVTEFAPAHSQKVGIQLIHIGRKASSLAPWLHPEAAADVVQGVWPDDMVGPTALAYSGYAEGFAAPKALPTTARIQRVVAGFASAVEAGFDAFKIQHMRTSSARSESRQ